MVLLLRSNLIYRLTPAPQRSNNNNNFWGLKKRKQKSSDNATSNWLETILSGILLMERFLRLKLNKLSQNRSIREKYSLQPRRGRKSRKERMKNKINGHNMDVIQKLANKCGNTHVVIGQLTMASSTYARPDLLLILIYFNTNNFKNIKMAALKNFLSKITSPHTLLYMKNVIWRFGNASNRWDIWVCGGFEIKFKAWYYFLVEIMAGVWSIIVDLAFDNKKIHQCLISLLGS